MPAAIAGVKALVGAFAKKPNLPKKTVPTEAKEAANLARGQANQTVAPGYSVHLESLRKMGADALAQAKRTVKDPAQLQSIMSQINNMVTKGASDLKGLNERYRVQALANLQGQLSNLAKHRVRVQDENIRQEEQYRAAQSNLFGSAFRDANTAANQFAMNKEMQNYMDTINTIYGNKGGNEYNLPDGSPT